MVKKYLQDMVARTGGPAPGAPEASSTPLSPLACNTPTVSGRSRSGTSKPAPGSLPAKRPASTRRGRGDPNKSKGESLKPASVAGKVSPDDTGGHVAAINPLQGDDNASLTRKSNSGAKRQKLGDLKFASPDGLRVAEAQTGEPLCTEAARATSAGLGKRCSGRSPTVTEACPSQGAETEAPKEAAQKHLRLVSVEGKVRGALSVFFGLSSFLDVLNEDVLFVGHACAA